MIIPEDGLLPPITSSKLNLSNNIMIVKVDDKFKKPGETTYQLATLDRSKKGPIWPADSFVEKLIPELRKNKTGEEHDEELATKKDCNKPSNKIRPNRSKLVHRGGPRKQRLGTRRPNLARKRNWSDRSDVHLNKPQVKDIDPWVQKPWEQSNFNTFGVIRSTDICPRPGLLETPIDKSSSWASHKGLLGDYPPGEFETMNFSPWVVSSASNNSASLHSRFVNNHPSNNFYGYHEMPTGDLSEHYSKNNRALNPRGHNYKNLNYSSRDFRHDKLQNESYGNYVETTRNDQAMHYTFNAKNYSGFHREVVSSKMSSDKFEPRDASSSYVSHKLPASNSRRGPRSGVSSFGNSYRDSTQDKSLIYDHPEGIEKNETTHRKAYPPINVDAQEMEAFVSDFGIPSSGESAKSTQRPNMTRGQRRFGRGKRSQNFRSFKKRYNNSRNRR